MIPVVKSPGFTCLTGDTGEHDRINGAGVVRGIGRIAASACENIARQPEAGGRIFTSMIITAAMIEGATLFGVVVCLLPALK